METDPVSRATQQFNNGYSCSQAVFSAFAAQYGLPEELALRIAGTFGGGASRSGQLCGAVSGGLMVLGLAFGCTDPTDTAGKDRAYAIGWEFMQSFQARNEGLLCRDLIRYDLSESEGLKAARASGVFKSVCPRFVRIAAEILVERLAEAEG